MSYTTLHKCTTCNRSFARRGDERRHNRTEHNPNVGRIFCPYPESIKLTFTSISSFPTISWSHANPEWLPCAGSAKHGQETNLTTHMLKHVGYRWPCPTCGKQFLDRASLSRHAHSWSTHFRSEQRDIQHALLMRGESWLRSAERPTTSIHSRIGMLLWDALGSGRRAVSSVVSGCADVVSTRQRTSAVRSTARAFHPYLSPGSRPHNISRRFERSESPEPEAVDDEEVCIAESPPSITLEYALPLPLGTATPPGSPNLVSVSSGDDDEEFESLIDPGL